MRLYISLVSYIKQMEMIETKMLLHHCSYPGVVVSDSDSLVLDLRGGAGGPVRHPGGAESGGGGGHQPGHGDQLQHGGGGEAGRDAVPAAPAAPRYCWRYHQQQ